MGNTFESGNSGFHSFAEGEDLSAFLQQNPDTSGADTAAALQQRKDEIINELKTDIENIDSLEPLPNQREVYEIDGDYHVFLDNQEMHPVRVSDILCDGVWNVDYYLDSRSISPALRKKYLIQRAEDKLHQLSNMQLLYAKINDRTVSKEERQSYEAILERQEKGRSKDSGVIAEKMAINLLKRYQIDGELPYKVIPANVVQDVSSKIDFFIIRTDDLEKDTEKPRSAAVQFFVNAKPKQRAYKQQQIEMVNDKITGSASSPTVENVVLVHIRMTHLNQLVDRWKKAGSLPGGPESQLKGSIKRQIFYRSLSAVFYEEELEGFWKNLDDSKSLVSQT